MKHAGIGVLPFLLLLLPGCSERKASVGFEDVRSKVNLLTEQRIAWDREDVPAANPANELLEQKEISVDAAVQIALLKNPTLQATFEELGIAEAEVREAGLLKNPVFGAEIRFPNRPDLATNSHFDIAISFIDLILAPMRKKVEAMRFDATKTRVTWTVLNLVADVRVAYYQLQAEQAKLPLRKDALLASEAASEFAQKLLKAKNMSEVDVLPKVALFHQARLEATREALQIAGLQEKLSRLLGVPAAQIAGRIPEKLPELPAGDNFGSVEALETQAVAERLDLDLQRQDAQIIDKARALRRWGAFTAVEFGASTERGPEPVRVSGPTAQMEFPIFNRGQADRARLTAQLHQSRDKLAALELEVRSEVRETLAELTAARATFDEFRISIAPLRARAVELAQERYNAMTLSALDLLTAKQEQLNSQIEQVEAQRDYWIHRIELERALGGRLPKSSEAEPRKE